MFAGEIVVVMMQNSISFRTFVAFLNFDAVGAREKCSAVHSVILRKSLRSFGRRCVQVHVRDYISS